MIFFPPFLGGVIFQAGVARKGMLPFLAFSLASSSTYILNDLLDRHNDSHHPLKSKRPIPSGKISFHSASLISILLAVAAFLIATTVSLPFVYWLLAYFFVSISYSLCLKDIVLVDVFAIAAGFLVRLEAGGSVFGIPVSPWLFLSVFLLAIFLSFGKRMGEIRALGEHAGKHRKSLSSYPDRFLEGAMQISGSAVLVTYTMYVINHQVFLLTVPLCCYGLLRFILRIRSGGGGDPTESLLKDPHLFVVGLLWSILVGFGIYR